MSVEIQIKDNFQLAPIEWNYEQAKAAMMELVEPYKSVIVTEDAVSVAKSDLARLRKYQKAINDRKIEIKKEYEAPYKAFEAQVKDVLSVIDTGISNIDRQVKDFDERRKELKRQDIAAYWQTVIGNIPVKLDSVLNPKWLNASVKLEQVKTEIDDFIRRITADIETVKMMNSPFETELMHTLFSTLDISAVLRHKQALESLSKQKEVEAEREHAEPEKSVPAPSCEATEETIAEEPKQNSIDTPMPLEVIDIRSWCTPEQKHAFRKFLVDNGIRYGAVE